jgi:hypothetical protein
MTDPLSGLILDDLDAVLDVVVETVDTDQIRTIKSLSDLKSVFLPPDPKKARDLWAPLFEAALEESPQKFTTLLEHIMKDMGKQSRDAMKKALQETGIRAVSRIVLARHPEFSDAADALISADNWPAITVAASNLRAAALGARRLLMHPLVMKPFLQLDPTVMDPEKRRMELADLAVDVVTAVDFLLTLMDDGNAAPASKLVLANEITSGRGYSSVDEDSSLLLTARRLDARNTAVKVGMRLLAKLRSDVGVV